VALKAGSCAAERYETRQVREEAAVNSSFWVPQEYLARAGWPGQAAKRDQERGHSLIKPLVANSPAKRYISAMPDSLTGNGSLLSQTKALLHRHRLRALKGMGQHFLVNSAVLKVITQAAGLSSRDLVIEIGPGMGILTRELVAQSGYVIAVELDPRMIELLEPTLLPHKNFSLINQDILSIEPRDLIEREKYRFPATVADPSQYKLVANLPYYITQPIIRHFCEARLKPQTMVIMVQKEVAQNIVSSPGALSILAISVQFYGCPRIVGYVPASSFYPLPKVDSAILEIALYTRPQVQVSSEKSFFEIVRAGFCAARKQLANSLAQGLDMPKPEVLSLIRKAGIDPQKRAEALSLEDWARLENITAEARNKC
jgi:16S rRNA (adenine1518-N6/adenine1519-N6)-dimethyltransferase